MGGGIGGNFGNTWGSSLNALSNLLTAASFIPFLDTFTNFASVPVDLARGDFISAGLSAAGIVPVFGEVADVAKAARLADKTLDAAKIADKASDAAKVAKVVDKATDTAKASKKAYRIASVADNAKSVAKKYSLGKNGYFGTKGKNTQVFKCADPLKASSDFYKKISKGGLKSSLSNGKGVQTVFPDGSRVVYREITKTPNSPAVSITVTNPKNMKSQKIHFIK